MSGAFCVFGVSRTHCRKQAEKNVSTVKLTITEWAAKVAVEADRLFDESDKQKRISPELDAPQFCEDWIAASPGQVKLTKIMCRGDKIDKHGAVTLRGGMPVQTWLDYDPHAAHVVPPNPPQFPFAQVVAE